MKKAFFKIFIGSIGALLAFPAIAPASETLRIVALGDSLTAGYRLPADQSFAAKLEKALNAGGAAVSVFNAGVSGDTTADGLRRAPALIAQKPQMMIIELGANDCFRNVDPAVVEANLSQIIEKAQAAGIKVVLAGMLATPSAGEEYAASFNGIYPRLAKKYGVPLYPFFMEGIFNPHLNVARTDLLQPDGIHPTAGGVDEIVGRFAPYVKGLIKAFRLQ